MRVPLKHPRPDAENFKKVILKEKIPQRPPLIELHIDEEIIKELEAKEEGEEHFFQEFLKMLFYLGILVGFMLVLTKFLKKNTTQRNIKLNEDSPIKILEQRIISQRSTLLVIECYDKKILIAESVNGIQAITDL